MILCKLKSILVNNQNSHINSIHEEHSVKIPSLFDENAKVCQVSSLREKKDLLNLSASLD